MYWLFVILILISQIGNAACAWVLWENRYSPQTFHITWSIIGSSDSSQKCDKALADKIKQRLSSQKENEIVESKIGTGRGSIHTRVTYDNGWQFGTQTTYYCLPDTVDPQKL